MGIRVFFLLTLVTLIGCAAPPKVSQSQRELQAYQSKEFEASKRQLFDATLSVLQDSGFIIRSADYETGFLTGKGTSDSRFHLWWGTMNKSVEMTAFIEQRTSSMARVRINIISTDQRKSAWNPAQDVIDQEGIRDPKVYQELFEKIDQSIFIRKNL